MDKYAHAYGMLQAMQEVGMPPSLLLKIAHASDDPILMVTAQRVCNMAQSQAAVMDPAERAKLANIAAAYGLPAATLAAGAGLGLGGAYGMSDADTLSNNVRGMLGMDTQSKLENALGMGAGALPVQAARDAGNYMFNNK